MITIGRNDLCPCQSGQKYKKCCLAQDEQLARSPRSSLDYAAKKRLIKSAYTFPIDHVYINSDWKESGLARITVSRLQANGRLILANFLVDIFCLGVKDAFCHADIAREEMLDEILPACYFDQEPIQVQLNCAKSIIFGAIAYAQKLGFQAHSDFNLARYVLGDETITQEHDITFGGPQNKPFYIAGPHDDIAKIQRQLIKEVGVNGYDFLLPVNA